MKPTVFIAFLVISSLAVTAQPYSIKGSVWDTLNNNALQRASVVLIRAKDSVIETHLRTQADGSFDARVKTMGKYLLRISFPSFADFTDALNVKKDMDLGQLPMVSKSLLLKEFVLTKQVAAIKIKGDTTEYMADSFKVRENATVEDLLKKLPGIQVDKNGQITAQGETVQKILVDGEEFFSDDPKVVTKGLQANAVNKVQVFDKKSEQAEFTGIDDGQKIKTINLELKDDKKKGYFGKLDAGGGSDGYYQEQGMLNAFKGKRQLSLFGIMANTDKAGLGWQDNDKFGSGNGNTVITDGGDMVTYFSSNDEENFTGWNGKYNGEGLPKTWTGGAHYADKWNEGKSHLSGNYRYAKQNVDIEGNTLVQNTLGGDTVRINSQTKDQFSTGIRNGVDMMHEWKIDSNTTVKITATGGTKNAQTASTYNAETMVIEGADTLTGTNNRTITSDANAEFLNADLVFKRKFAKKGRTLSIDLKENYKDSKSSGIFLSTTTPNIANPGLSFLTNQRKQINSNTLAFSGKATYTEPLSKSFFVEGDYGVTVNNSTALNYSYDTNATGSFSDAPNSIFSSNYQYNILSNMGGAYLKYDHKKTKFSLGGDVSNAQFLQKDLLNGDTTHKYSFLNFFPKANFTYNLAKQTSVSANYSGKTQQPTISQIQPLRQNVDPLNITVGNPDLKQEFVNTVSLRFNDYKVLGGRYFWSNISFSNTSNAITTEQTTLGAINTTRYINMDGKYFANGYLGYGLNLKQIDLNMGVYANGAVTRINNIINKQVNTSDYSSITIGAYSNFDKEDKFEFSLGPDLTYNTSTATISNTTTSFWTFSTDASGTVQLPKKFEVNSSVDVMIRQKTEVFTGNNNVIRWNAYVSKKFMKKSELELKLSVFDILNQNIGFSRTATANMVSQNSYNTIRRYGMLSLIWNFTHTPAGSPTPEGGGVMMVK
jgi:outer membrane receptor protein involved in Fe transport